VTFQTESEFIAWLREQPENNYSYSFLPGSKYPLSVQIERKPDRVILKEI
jgi:hypothetical protein